MDPREATNLVLFVSEHRALQQLLRDRCRAEGFRLITESSIEDAEDSIHGLRPSAIILDVQDNPPQPAHAADCPVSKLADLIQPSHTPIIAITAENRTADKLAAFDAGAYDTLAAPFDISELIARIANARERSRLAALLSRESNLDALTGLWNRAHFDKSFAKHVDLTTKGEGSLSLIVADLDHFKRINDSQGHRFGDSVLQVFANILTKVLRSEDKAFRYGGEEFAIILRDTEDNHVSAIAERIRATLARCSWTPPQDHAGQFRVTCSMGIATQSEAPTTEAWFDAADSALYAAKRAGRDRVFVAIPNSMPQPILVNESGPRRLAG